MSARRSSSTAVVGAIAPFYTPDTLGNLGFSSAVAAFGMLLRNSAHKGDASWQMAADLATRHRGADPDGYRAQFVRLVEMAEGIARANGTGAGR